MHTSEIICRAPRHASLRYPVSRAQAGTFRRVRPEINGEPAGASARRSRTPSHTKKIQRIASFLRTHYAGKIDLPALAARHGRSRRTFFRDRQKLFPGDTPHQHLLSLRLQKGRRLPRSEMPISEIAREPGCSDASGFTEQFRRRYGETPPRFRKRALIRAAETPE